MTARSMEPGRLAGPDGHRSRALRAPFAAETIVHVKDQLIGGRSANLSCTGMLVQVPLDAPGGFFVRLQFMVAPRTGICRGWMDVDALQVREVIESERRLWGVKFLQLSSDQALALWNFVVEEHRRQLPSAQRAHLPPPLPMGLTSPGRDGADPEAIEHPGPLLPPLPGGRRPPG